MRFPGRRRRRTAGGDLDSFGADIIGEDMRARFIKRLLWLNSMRWFAAGSVSLGILAAAYLKLPLPMFRLLACLTVLIATNIAYIRISENLSAKKTSPALLYALFYTEIFFDFAVLLCIIHFSGGATNMFAFSFAFHIIIAGVVVPSVATYMLAGAAAALMSGVAFAEFCGRLPHYSLGAFGIGPHMPTQEYTLHFIGAFAAVMLTTAYVSSAVGAMLKRREQYLSSLHAELAERNADMRAANERLQEIDRTKTNFMRMAAHEIRSPVSSMISLMHTITGGYVEDKEQIIAMVRTCAGRADDALAFSRDLLSLAREKSRDLEPENLDVCKEILAVAGAFEEAARAKGIALETDIPAQQRSVFDRESFALVLTHLVDNALRYSHGHAGPVNIALTARADELALTVSDHGIGIAEDDIERLPQEFFRAGNGRSHAHMGTGLGLSIAWRAAKNLGGAISCRSSAGEGSEFTLTWPLRQ